MFTNLAPFGGLALQPHSLSHSCGSFKLLALGDGRFLLSLLRPGPAFLMRKAPGGPSSVAQAMDPGHRASVVHPRISLVSLLCLLNRVSALTIVGVDHAMVA